jgi:DNA-binding transcriptional MocR family regulator
MNSDLFSVKDGSKSIFQYGPAVGYKEYLSELAKFLTDEYKDGSVSPDSLVLTCGATNGLHLAATTLMSQNRPLVAFVECPTYFIALNVLKKGIFFTKV